MPLAAGPCCLQGRAACIGCLARRRRRLHNCHVCRVQVAREEHFSPVKNAPGSATDSPDTARRDVMRLHARWVQAAGARLGGEAADAGVEVSPLVSYAGEGLEGRCVGAAFEELQPAALR